LHKAPELLSKRFCVLSVATKLYAMLGSSGP